MNEFSVDPVEHVDPVEQDLVRMMPTPELTKELRTIEHVWGMLAVLAPDQRERVLLWLCHEFEVGAGIGE